MDDRLQGPVAAIRRHGRAVAVAGAVVAVTAATFMTVAVAEAAPGAGTCIDNVNVRSAPKADASIVALCERGTHVKVGETKNGFVELPTQKGWAAQEYVEVDGRTPRAPVERGGEPTTSPTDDESGSATPSRRSAAPKPSATPRAAKTTPPAPRDSSDDADEDTEEPGAAAADAARGRGEDDDSNASEASNHHSERPAAAPRRVGLLG
jgi:uncharacterized protein YraI